MATAVATVLDKPEDDLDVQDLVWSLTTPTTEAWMLSRARAMAAHLAGPGAEPALIARLTRATLEMDVPTVGIRGQGESHLALTVSGLPVMHRGLSQSVMANQWRSLAYALGLVALLLSLGFRSVTAGLLCTAPTAASLLLVYGAMGALGVQLDIGTSMLASLVIGAGVDYGVHMQGAWVAAAGEPLRLAAARAAARTGTAIWTNALMVAVGFAVLTLGEARPLRNVGGLTATAMLAAGLTTFLILPVLARRRSYGHAELDDPADELLDCLDT